MQEEKQNNSWLDIEKEVIHWEKRKEIGFLKAFWLTWREVVFHPKRFFSKLSITEGIVSPLLFAIITFGIVWIIWLCFVWGVSFMRIEGFRKYIISFWAILFIPIFAILNVFIKSVFIHLGLWLVKAKKGFKATFKVIAYTEATKLFYLFYIPMGLFAGVVLKFQLSAFVRILGYPCLFLMIIGIFMIVIWPILLHIIGLKCVHNIRIMRTIFGYLIPFIAGFVILFTLRATFSPKICPLPRSGSPKSSSLWQEWQEDRDEAIKRLGEQAKEKGEVAVYGYIKFSDKGIKDIDKVNVEFAGEYWSRSGANAFKDGSFYWMHKLKNKEPVELTLIAICEGYEVTERKFVGENSKIFNLEEIVLKKLTPESFTAGIKGKVLLLGTEDYSGVKIEVVFEGIIKSDASRPKTYTSKDGSFQLTGLQPGKYVIYFSHPKFLIGQVGWYQLRKGEISNLGEIKATLPAIVHIEWARQREPGKGFKGGLRGKAVLRIKEKENGFDLNEGVVTGGDYHKERWEADVVLSQRGFPVPDELFFSVPYCAVNGKRESFIFDIGEKSVDEVINELITGIKPTHYYEVPVKAGHCYLVHTSHDGYLGIIKVVKIEM